jgi:hypothetical protein
LERCAPVALDVAILGDGASGRVEHVPAALAPTRVCAAVRCDAGDGGETLELEDTFGRRIVTAGALRRVCVTIDADGAYR